MCKFSLAHRGWQQLVGIGLPRQGEVFLTEDPEGTPSIPKPGRGQVQLGHRPALE